MHEKDETQSPRGHVECREQDCGHLQDKPSHDEVGTGGTEYFATLQFREKAQWDGFGSGASFCGIASSFSSPSVLSSSPMISISGLKTLALQADYGKPVWTG